MPSPPRRRNRRGMSSDSLARWLDRLERLHPAEIELGLPRVSAVAGALGLLTPKQPIVTVAGTNGKGSTVAVLEALLTECGRVVGTYTSPHFLRFNERIRVGGEEVADAEIVTAFEQVDRARGAISLTYFEFATLSALLVFREHGCDVLVLEVGLGGRLDAVNILDASVAVITSIDLDHQAWLGEDREQIAREKAGIVRPDRPVVVADPAPPQTLFTAIAAAGAGPVLRLGKEFSVREDGGEWVGTLWTPQGTPRVLPPVSSGPLLPANVCAALQAALLLGVQCSDAQVSRAIEGSAPPGRRQVCHVAGREYLLDVAHNPAAVYKLREYLTARYCYGRRYALFCAMADKDIRAMIQAAGDVFDGWFLADLPGNPRAEKAANIAASLRLGGQSVHSISATMQQALERSAEVMQEGDQMVVFGSFYTVASVLPQMSRETDA